MKSFPLIRVNPGYNNCVECVSACMLGMCMCVFFFVYLVFKVCVHVQVYVVSTRIFFRCKSKTPN